jgi:soluble lytic murein transglycosylase
LSERNRLSGHCRLSGRYRLAFILVFFLSFASCAAQPSDSYSGFYEGLKKRQEGAQSETVAYGEIIACFEKALNAANAPIAAAAAAELLSLHAAGAKLPEAAMAAIRQKAALAQTGGSWAQALNALEAADKEQFLSLLLNGESRSLDEAALYALEKWRSGADADATPPDSTGNISLTEAEAAVINGRAAASRSRYGEALLFFRIAVSAIKTPPIPPLRDSPDLFFRYPDLLIDLGRAFQYAGAGREGIELFLKWEKTFDKTFIPESSENLIRFRLLFFAARIARQRGEENIELFEQALPFALQVSPEQSDACIWYILDSSLAQGPAAVIRYLEKYISQWHDDAYFSDVLDKLARELILKRQWEDVANVCAILQSHFSGSRLSGNAPAANAALAQYAWVISRAIEEGLYSPEETAAQTAAAYRRVAYDAGIGSLYYRSLSAAALGEPFLVLQATESPQAAGKTARTTRTKKTAPAATPSPTMEFLLGFFEHNAAGFAPRYIRPLENDLSAEELRSLAAALGAAGQYQESMRLVTLYSRRSGYQMIRQDWELLYPRPFKEPVERYAGETGIEPALLYALIRTESAFDHTVVSRAGAVGLTQLMPATAREMAARIRRGGGPDYIPDSEDAAIDLRDPAINLHIGAVYLAYLNERMEDPLLALLAYNGGMNRVRRWHRASNIPPDIFLETIEYAETRNYGRSVMGAAAMYTELYYSNLE